MPAAATASASRKRKPDTMDESPPKRVTRARSAKATATETTKPSTTSKAAPKSTKITTSTERKTTKITTASAKVAAASKPAPKTTARSAIVKRTFEEDAMGEASDDELELIERPVPVKRGRGRPRKDESEQPARSAKTAIASTAARAKKSAGAVSEAEAAMAAKLALEKDEKMTKTTGAMRATRGTARTTANQKEPVKRAAPRKKVTFDDEATQNKENVPMEVGTKSTTSKAASVKTSAADMAAPAKATTAKATTTKTTSSTTARGRKPTAKKNETEKAAAPPLSPKKVTQLAKSVSSGSEDELCDQSPVRALSKSPKKAPSSVRSVIKVAPAMDRQRPPTPSSPSRASSKEAEAVMLRNPAKRPPPSPFKDAIKYSPIKFNLPPSPAKLDTAQSQPDFKHSLQASPRKVNLNLSGDAAGSPKRSPQRAPLLSSPAKRPISPEKTRLFASTSKSPGRQLGKTTPRFAESAFKLPTITPHRLFISPRADTGAKQTMSDETNAESEETHTSPSPVHVSPAKVAFVQYNTNPLAAYNQELAQQGKLPAPGTPRYRAKSYEYDSDDEHLSSPSKSQHDGTPTFIFKTPNGKVHRRETMGITPLALKTSTWCVTSPEKNQQPASPLPEEEVDSLSLSPSVEGPGLVATMPTNASYFEAEMVARESSVAEVMGSAVGDWHEAEGADEVEEQVITMPSDDEDVENIQPVSDAHDSFIATDTENIVAPAEEMKASQSLPLEEAEPMELLEDCTATAAEFEYPEFMDVDENASAALCQDSQEFENYGDENAFPIDPALFGKVSEPDAQHEATFIPTEAAATPNLPRVQRHREVHTVCKVPLRQESSEQSPIKVQRKRRHSTSAPLGELPDLARPLSQSDDSLVSQAQAAVARQAQTPSSSPRKVSYETSIINAMMTPTPSNSRVVDASPTKSAPRTGSATQILRGAVVYVDVHTSEGADASSLFVELLTQMGARCVKQWSWNPRHSGAASANGTPSGKVGITHVVFKDGGKRTLQKVRDAKGLVICVGVTWVLDCERSNEWLDEAPYAIDSSTIPRGGHNRRKSMEPRMIANQGGTLVPAVTPVKGAYEVQSPTAEFRAFSAASRRSSIRVSPLVEPAQEPMDKEQDPQPLATPSPFIPDSDEEVYDLAAYGAASPTTPYFLSKGAQLVQQTCPPKTLGQPLFSNSGRSPSGPLFPISGLIADQPDEGVRQRLAMARRKSLQWAPKIKSPLGRAVSYEREAFGSGN